MMPQKNILTSQKKHENRMHAQPSSSLERRIGAQLACVRRAHDGLLAVVSSQIAKPVAVQLGI